MKRAFLLFALAISPVFFWACQRSKGPEGNTFKIGVVTSLTGSNAAFGQAHKNGYTIALEEINAKGGLLGKQVELDYYDDQSRPDQAVQGVSKLVDQDRVPIVLGAYSSESTRAIVPVVTQKQIPLIIPTAVADNVMESNSPWIFRICAGSGSFATATLDFLKNNGDPKKLAIVSENTNFGQANNKSMTEAAKAAGLDLVDSESYQASSPDYKSLLQRVKGKNPEVIYFASYLLDASTLMRQSEQLNLNPKYYTSAGTGFAAAEFPTMDKGAGKYAEYTFSVSQWLPSAKWKGSQNSTINTSSWLAPIRPITRWRLMRCCWWRRRRSIMRSPTSRRQFAMPSSRSTSPETPFGPVKFDARGQNQHPVLITQVQGGQYKVVWPPDAAESKPIIPAPEWSKRK